jgi:small subunit ribosomal protein S21|tara:strand:+ start:58 stop:258 length:201 start_codon:yes stop_codon:yes gene_type:complete
MKVVVKNKNFEKALRQFKRKTVDEGIVFEVRERGYYEKPSDKRRRKHKAAVNRSRKKNGNITKTKP